MVPWREVNIEAPIARAFLDRGLTGASHIITLGALAGLTSVMLVMLLGQTRVLYSMANDGLLPKKFFADIHPRFRTPWKNTMLVGLLAAIVGSLTPIDDIGKMVNIGTLLAFVIVCIAILALRHTNPGQPRPFRTPWVPFVPVMGIIFNGYMMYKLGWINWARLIMCTSRIAGNTARCRRRSKAARQLNHSYAREAACRVSISAREGAYADSSGNAADGTVSCSVGIHDVFPIHAMGKFHRSNRWTDSSLDVSRTKAWGPDHKTD
jgi:amino acid transporter